MFRGHFACSVSQDQDLVIIILRCCSRGKYCQRKVKKRKVKEKTDKRKNRDIRPDDNFVKD